MLLPDSNLNHSSVQSPLFETLKLIGVSISTSLWFVTLIFLSVRDIYAVKRQVKTSTSNSALLYLNVFFYFYSKGISFQSLSLCCAYFYPPTDGFNLCLLWNIHSNGFDPAGFQAAIPVYLMFFQGSKIHPINNIINQIASIIKKYFRVMPGIADVLLFSNFISCVFVSFVFNEILKFTGSISKTGDQQ